MTQSQTHFAELCRQAYDGAPPDWILALAKGCDELGGHEAAAKACRISRTAVSLLVRNQYRRAAREIEAKVRGRFMSATVDCPVLGEIGRNACADHQATRADATGTNPGRARLYRACQTCPHNLKTGASDV